jgi:hypothetical protein
VSDGLFSSWVPVRAAQAPYQSFTAAT